MEKVYKHLFFDLDRTLWDFDKNSEQTLLDIFQKWFLFKNCNCSFDDFLKIYRETNHQLWEDYRQNKISKEFLNVERFRKTLELLKCEHFEIAQQLADYYVEQSPLKTLLFPDAEYVLQQLKNRYQLHIITNGFEEIQFRKLKNAKLEHYFSTVITSEMAGCKKPDPEIFTFSLKLANSKPFESIMIGDDPEVDILGAENYGMDSVFVNFGNVKTEIKSTFEVKNLLELLTIL